MFLLRKPKFNKDWYQNIVVNLAYIADGLIELLALGAIRSDIRIYVMFELFEED